MCAARRYSSALTSHANWGTDTYCSENPYLTADACEALVKAGAAFAGID